MLTPVQAKVLRFIVDYQKDGMVSPTVKEVAEALGSTSKSHAHRILIGLEERGFIRRLPKRPRAIEILRSV